MFAEFQEVFDRRDEGYSYSSANPLYSASNINNIIRQAQEHISAWANNNPPANLIPELELFFRVSMHDKNSTHRFFTQEGLWQWVSTWPN